VDEMGGACSTHRRDEKCYSILVRIPEGKRLLKKPRHKWEDNIRMDVRESGWENVEWIHLVQDRYELQALVNVVMNLQVSYEVGNF
jgi:hypothetical protein